MYNMPDMISYSSEQTYEYGKAYAQSLVGGEIIVLEGELGAGKTMFTKGLADGLGITATVLSPTFTIMNSYDGRLKLYHFDAYRLNGSVEVEEAGLAEYFGDPCGVCVVEWASNIEDFIDRYPHVNVHIKYLDDNTREIIVHDK